MKFMDSRKERIVNLLPVYSNALIARAVNCSDEYVRQIRRECGIPSSMFHHTCSRFMNEAMLTGVLRDLKQGHGLRTIAGKNNVKYGYLLYFLKKNNFIGPGNKNRPRVFELRDYIKLKREGLNYRQISDKLGISLMTAYRWYRRCDKLSV